MKLNFLPCFRFLLAWIVHLIGQNDSLRADCNLVEVRLTNNAVFVRWNSRAGFAYEVLSADKLEGPWGRQAEVTAIGPSSNWTDPRVVESGARFYQIRPVTPDGCNGDIGLDTATEAALFEADSAPRVLVTTYQNSRQLAAEAVYFASQLGASGRQVVTTGTLQQAGQAWSYSTSPSNRLVVLFPTQKPAEFFITTMQGDFSADASRFLNNSHILEWRSRAEGLGDFAFSSRRTGRLIDATAKGTMPWKSGEIQVEVASQVDDYFESSSGGSETITDNRITGTMSAPEFQLQINQRFRFQIISQDGVSASTSEEWLGSQLNFLGATFRWVDVKKQKSFRDGKPSGVDDYWKATGQVLRNDAVFGQYRKTYASVGNAVQVVKFLVEFPNRSIEIESWNIF